MIMQEDVNTTDRIFLTSDFRPGDTVFITIDFFPVFGIVYESTEDMLSIRTSTKSCTFDSNSTPPLSFVLENITKNMNFDMIAPGVIMSKVIQKPDGMLFRVYAEITSVSKNKRDFLEKVTICILNGGKAGETREIETSINETLRHKLSYWEIEE